MKKIRYLAALLALSLMAGLGLVALSPAGEAEAFSYGRSRVTHKWNSERKVIKTATKYNGEGHRSEVKRGHRLPEEAGKIRSVWVPKGCTLLTNGWAYQTAWTQGDWANIGKVPYVTISLRMDCGFIKVWTG